MKRTLMGDYPRYQKLNLAHKKGTYIGSVTLANRFEQQKNNNRRIALIMSNYPKATF